MLNNRQVDPMYGLQRRRFLAALGGTLLLPNARVFSAEPDLDTPAANLQAFVKLLGALDRAPVYDMVRGSVYALTPGRPAIPLFRTVGVGVATYQKVSENEYRSSSRYVGLLLDWDEEQPLRSWKNPMNNALCEVPVTKYGPGEARIFSDRILPLQGDVDVASLGTRRWFRLGDVMHIQRAVFQGTVPHPLFPKADLMTYSGSWQQLSDPALTRVPSRLNFAAVESWRPWMRMEPDDPPGTLWWHVSGVKLDSAAAYPENLRSWVMEHSPDFFAAG